MAPSDSDSWDDYPWIKATRLRSKPKKKIKTKKKKDLNKGPVPTAYMIRVADDGTKWHSFIDILRPHSPPVEWPEYPDRPTEEDFPEDINWDNVSLPDPDIVKDLAKTLGIPESELRASVDTNSKKVKKIDKKLKKIEEKLAKMELEHTKMNFDQNCSQNSFVPEIPELISDNDMYAGLEDEIEPDEIHTTAGYGGGVTSRLDELDDFYPHDSGDTLAKTKGGLGPKNAERDVQYDFTEDYEDVDSGPKTFDREQFWKELQTL